MGPIARRDHRVIMAAGGQSRGARPPRLWGGRHVTLSHFGMRRRDWPTVQCHFGEERMPLDQDWIT